MKLRIKFNKKGPVRFIGHLDVMRYFQKCIRRAEIDIAYTSGYSPHQIMSFAAPLSVGLESNGEYMDIEVNSILSSEDTVRRLNDAGIPGIRVLSAKRLPDDAKNAMASVAAASYTVSFTNGFTPDFDLGEAICDFMNRPEIIITKKTKKSTFEMDLKPGIYKMECKDNGIYLMVNASSSGNGNIKPGIVLGELFRFRERILPDYSFFITREDTYLNLGDEEHPDFAPLDAIGEEIPEEKFEGEDISDS